MQLCHMRYKIFLLVPIIFVINAVPSAKFNFQCDKSKFIAPVKNTVHVNHTDEKTSLLLNVGIS